jgi:hypothetical protein
VKFMKNMIKGLLFFVLSSVAAAATDYPLPNPAVVPSLSYTGNACSFSKPIIKVIVAGATTFSGPVTNTAIYAQGPYQRYLWGWTFAGTLTAVGGATATYGQDWALTHSGGKGYTCYLNYEAGDLSVN